MGSEVSKEGMSESESFWPRFRRSIKRKGKKQFSKPSHFSNHAAEISPTRLNSGKSESSVRIVSISREGESIPVIRSPAGKAISNDQQPAVKKKPLGFDATEIKVKSHDAADISVKSRESEVCSEELYPKQISEEEEEVSARKLDRRSWVRIAKAFRFTAALDLHPNSRNGPKVSQDSNRGGHANYTPVIEQRTAQEIRQKKEVADSISGPIEQPSKSSRISAEVNSKNRKLWKSIDFHRNLSSRASSLNSSFKRQEIESADWLSSLSSYPQIPCPDMAPTRNSTAPNSQPNKLNLPAERKGTVTGSLEEATGEGYDTVISLGVLIIIMGCLVVLSDRFVAIVCTSVWWYLLPRLLKKDRAAIAAAGRGVNNGIPNT
jgi:hypothetical protein